MKNNQIIKLSAAMAFISFMFFPIAGCGNFNFNGVDLIFEDNVAFEIKILCIGAMACALTIIFLKEKIKIFYNAIAGIIFLLMIYISYKYEMKSKLKDDEYGISKSISNSIELKFGAYLSIISFAFIAYVSKSKNEILSESESKNEENITKENI